MLYFSEDLKMKKMLHSLIFISFNYYSYILKLTSRVEVFPFYFILLFFLINKIMSILSFLIYNTIRNINYVAVLTIWINV